MIVYRVIFSLKQFHTCLIHLWKDPGTSLLHKTCHLLYFGLWKPEGIKCCNYIHIFLYIYRERIPISISSETWTFCKNHNGAGGILKQPWKKETPQHRTIFQPQNASFPKTCLISSNPTKINDLQYHTERCLDNKWSI